MKEPNVTLELAQEHGLNEEEYAKIVEYLGRIPTFTELGVFSVMWSEHCSYKNSIALLKTLPRSGRNLLVGAGEENAGLVDIGDGLACAFKIESHNHPSAIEPYQGAATGVGGIHRDIFSMGARPIASLNSLRFGKLTNPRVRYLFDGVVRGIGDYGNAFGVPTVAGEVFFDESYEGNPLVNAMSVGLVKVGETGSAVAPGVGNPVFIVGASTGRDGIHGATFASEEISEESESKRPAVQVGDPFTEKLLLEATLEALKTGAVLGLQDMGAAGISCSSSEMSAKSETGMDINLDLVPQREENMTAYEMLLSESQERMLFVVEKGREAEVVAVFEKWDLKAVQIGEVTESGRVRYSHKGEIKADIPAYSLVLGGGAPVYYRETKRPDYIDKRHAFDFSTLTHSDDYAELVYKMLSSPNIASKSWVYEQYDTMVRTNTVVGPGPSDSAVVRIKGTKKALVMKTDCNGRYVYLNPRKGAQIAVVESARNVICSGGKPMAVTNNLNFGNPYKPEQYWVIKEAVTGMGEACRLFDTPVTGGNVSFYNENPKGAVFPTPTIGMLGLIDDIESQLMTMPLKNSGDILFYLGAERNGLGGTEYLSWVHGLTEGDAPHLDMDFEKAMQESLLEAIYSGKLNAVHDVSDGGLIISLIEMCIHGNLGADVKLKNLGKSEIEVLFSESQSGVLLSCSPENKSFVESHFSAANIPLYLIGSVAEQKEISTDLGCTIDLEKAQRVYENTIPSIMEKSVETAE